MVKRLLLYSLFIFLILLHLIFPYHIFAQSLIRTEANDNLGRKSSSPQIEVYFSPRGGAQDAIIRAINNAQKEILVMAYSFTSAPIADALITAYKKGLTILVLLDKSQLTARASKIQELASAHIPVFIDKAHAIAHNKVIIIDEKFVITGSYNFTKAAEERNAENLLLITNEELAKEYIRYFSRHKKHAIQLSMDYFLSSKTTSASSVNGKSCTGVVQNPYSTKKGLTLLHVNPCNSWCAWEESNPRPRA